MIRADRALEVLAPGPLATVQDLGRLGYTDLGVSRSGAADRGALRLANRLVGNSEAAAGIEITLGGLVVRLSGAATVAFTGARCQLTGHRGGWNSALSCPAGSVLSLGPPSSGLRSYLAVRGGLAVEPVLGSRSTDTLSGLGPAVLAAGRRLPIGAVAPGQPGDVDGAVDALGAGCELPAGTARLRLAPGPRADWFEPGSLGRLFDSPWQLRPDSNRIGTRLAGPALRLRPGTERAAAELPSEPTLPGALQVPPDGQPIVLGPDAPVTGGYPVVGVLPGADLGLLAQLRPGARLRFVSVPIDPRSATAARPR
ncbi:MAG TPA: biotin-dependent carboxyltransferase family protein [Jatrophihabitans sp.]|nr:biotin-dependent carboxyltransferase family protein [Jatrophihabitans sp.]